MTYILIVEDDHSIQLMVRRKLENSQISYPIRGYTNGAEGLQAAMENRPQLALLDVALPHVSGLEICRAIKDRYGENAPPVILISAYGQAEHVKAGEDAGADDYIIKPFSPRDLLDVVLSHLAAGG
ncbi:MAG: hypothetical protein OHK0023_09520 [Anaerolineae bacterium]